MYTDFRSLGLLQPKFLTIGLTSWLILFPISIAYAEYDYTRNSFIQFNPFAESPFRSKDPAEGVIVLVTVVGVQGRSGTSTIISVAYQTQNHVLCERDKRPLNVQRMEPILSEEFEFRFAEGEIKIGESFDVCLKTVNGFSDCKALTNRSEKQAQKVSFTLLP
jgi:hypothetical protein